MPAQHLPVLPAMGPSPATGKLCFQAGFWHFGSSPGQMRNRFIAADGARVAPRQRYLRREQWLHKLPWFGGNLLSLAEPGRRDEGASRGKMAPPAVAEPALPVLPC